MEDMEEVKGRRGEKVKRRKDDRTMVRWYDGTERGEL